MGLYIQSVSDEAAAIMSAARVGLGVGFAVPQEVTISQSNLRKFNEALEKGTPSLLSGAFCDMIAQLSRELVPQFMRFRHQARTAAERTAETAPTALAA